MARNLHLGALWAALGLAVVPACAFQVGAGTTPGRIPKGRTGYATAALQTAGARRDGTVLGARMTTLANGDGLKIRNAVAMVGYDWHVGSRHPFGAELATELGAGGSAFSRSSGIGMYTGVMFAPRVRLFGGLDREPGYALLMPHVELVGPILRGGAWMPAEGPSYDRAYLEFAGELVLRVTVATDLAETPAESVATDPTPELLP